MDPMIAFMIRHFLNGFLLGAASALALLLVEPASMLANFASDSLLGTGLIIFSLGSPIGLGSLATALFFDLDA